MRDGPISREDSLLSFLLIHSTSNDIRSGSFSGMHGKFNKCESGFLVHLPKAWTTSRIQPKVNERTILYLTADTLAQSSLLNFCLMQNGRNISFQYGPSLIK